MRVMILGFGSVWRISFGKDPNDPTRFLRAAYRNTTGVDVNGQIRTRPIVKGHVRFNGVGGFDANHPTRMLYQVFECEGPSFWEGQFKLFCREILPRPTKPELFLIAVTHLQAGRIVMGSPEWKSESAFLISFSECRDRQEALILMPAYAWIRTQLGVLVLEPSSRQTQRPMLPLSIVG